MSGFQEIPAIAGTSAGSGTGPPQKQPKIDDNEKSYVECTNGPIIRYEFRDPDNNTEKIMVIIPKFGGISDIRYCLDACGVVFSVSFNWPKICYSPLDLFKRMTANPAFSKFHPKVTGMETELKKFREKKDEIPRGTIQIDLPRAVQTDKTTIIKKVVMGENGEEIVMVELSVVSSDNYNDSIDDDLIA
jgi:hypothetical protein